MELAKIETCTGSLRGTGLFEVHILYMSHWKHLQPIRTDRAVTFTQAISRLRIPETRQGCDHSEYLRISLVKISRSIGRFQHKLHKNTHDDLRFHHQ